MKNLLIIYNLIFLLFGNVLFSSIHYLHEHENDHEHNYEVNECDECIIIENVNNYVVDFQEVNFSNNNINLLVYEYFKITEFNIQKTYLSRAPPLF